jgi:hypothetical protein
VSSIPPNPISWTGGTPAVTRPDVCWVSSSGLAIRGAMRPSPALRLKRLKRQMVGRASLTLLEQHFGLAPGRAPGQAQRPLERAKVQARPAAASPPDHQGPGARPLLGHHQHRRTRGCRRACGRGLRSWCHPTSPQAAKNLIWAHWQKVWVCGPPYMQRLWAQSRSCLRAQVPLFAGCYTY